MPSLNEFRDTLRHGIKTAIEDAESVIVENWYRGGGSSSVSSNVTHFPPLALGKPTTYTPPPPCHSGNVKILEYGGGTLYAGGWSRGAKEKGLAVIDLTGEAGPSYVSSYGPYGFDRVVKRNIVTLELPWLSFYIKDYGVPVYDREDWKALATDVKELLKSGVNVLVSCSGGHGRTGMTVSILAYLIRPKLTGDRPISWLRKVYCEEAVETKEQVNYVYRILGLPGGKREEPAKAWTPYLAGKKKIKGEGDDGQQSSSAGHGYGEHDLPTEASDLPPVGWS